MAFVDIMITMSGILKFVNVYRPLSNVGERVYFFTYPLCYFIVIKVSN